MRDAKLRAAKPDGHREDRSREASSTYGAYA
jgi:hypothetical protein